MEQLINYPRYGTPTSDLIFSSKTRETTSLVLVLRTECSSIIPRKTSLAALEQEEASKALSGRHTLKHFGVCVCIATAREDMDRM